MFSLYPRTYAGENAQASTVPAGEHAYAEVSHYDPF